MSDNGKRIEKITTSLMSIAQNTSIVSEFINDPPHQDHLISDGKRWNMVTSAIWVLGDTDLAISSYLRTPFPTDDGNRYLVIYGLLQAMFLQQDAVKHICEALDVKTEENSRLREIRNIRNISVGHPTHLERKPDNYFGFLSRISLSFSSFDLIKSHAQSKKDEFITVDTLELIVDQAELLHNTMQLVTETIRRRQLDHLEEHRSRKLASLLPDSMGYSFEKVFQGIYSPGSGNRDFALVMLKSIQDQHQAFIDALKSRGELSDYTKYDSDTFLRAVSQIEKYLEGRSGDLIERDARIYAHYIREENKSFRQIAIEIDEKYGASPFHGTV